MESASLLSFTFHSLEVIEPALSCYFALKLLQVVERHAGTVSSGLGLRSSSKGGSRLFTHRFQKFHQFGEGNRLVCWGLAERR